MITKQLMIVLLAAIASTPVALQGQVEQLATATDLVVPATALIASKASESTPFTQALIDQAARQFGGSITLYYSYDVAAYLGLLDEAVRLDLYNECKDSRAPGLFALKLFLLIDMSSKALREYIVKSVVLASKDPQYKDLDGCPLFTSDADVYAYVTELINYSSSAFYSTGLEMTFLQHAVWNKRSHLVEAYMSLGANPALATNDYQLLPASVNNAVRDNDLKLHEHINNLLCNNAFSSTKPIITSAN